MRNSFTDLINMGVAKFSYNPIASEMPEDDIICRIYNNIWSIPSDTHMYYNKETNERYITGHMVGITQKWDLFVCSGYWGAINFKSSGYWSLCDFLHKNNLCGRYDMLNGEVIYKVIEINNSEIDNNISCPNCCVTVESKIPQPISVLTNDGNILKIKECFINKENLYDVCEALNNSIYVKGNNWTVNGNKIMCPIGNKTYIL